MYPQKADVYTYACICIYRVSQKSKPLSEIIIKSY